MPQEDLTNDPQDQQEETTEGQVEPAPSVETLQAELDEANRERSQFKVMAQRAQADMMNFRKRVEEEREEMSRSVAARTITKLLPIMDDLQRALDQVPAGAEEAAWLDGIRLIQRSLESLLESEGVTPIEADGKTFDPWEHEALFTMENKDKEAGVVVSVIRPGYKLRGKVLRPTQVAVAGPDHKDEEPIEEDEAQS